MSEENTTIEETVQTAPELTLGETPAPELTMPEAPAPAAAATATAPEAPAPAAPAAAATAAAPQAPQISLELTPSAPAAASAAEAAPDPQEYLADANLSDEEKKMVDDFTEKIDLKDSGIVIQYGNAAQKKVSDFADSALQSVKTKDLGEVGGMITDLVSELKGFSADTEQKKGFFGKLKSKVADVSKLKTKYDSAAKNVDRITASLEDHENTLQKDVIMLDKMYDSNLVYFKELTMYILAGKKKLAQERSTTLVELQNKAKETNLTEDAQAANDFASLCDRFEKKLYDLELTRTISMQMAPQIRLVQNSDTLMIEKIQSTVNNTIPLWKNQMVLALGTAHSMQAMQAQKEVNDLTNELIKKNAETLHQSTVDIAKESERGIVDMETVAHSNEELIATLDEVIQIHEEGRQKRAEAEGQLAQIEAQLKEKLLDIRNNTANA